MKNDYVYFELMVSASTAPLSEPITLVTVGRNPDGAVWEDERPALGIVTEVIERYGRRREGDFDAGTPRRPPSLKNLEEEGYWFDGRLSYSRYLQWGEGYIGQAEEDLHSRRKTFAFPTAGPRPVEAIAAAREQLAAVGPDEGGGK